MVDKKTETVENTIARLKRIAMKGIRKHDVELVLEAIAACAKIEYFWNQRYSDYEIEGLLKGVSSQLTQHFYVPDKNTVLFYDEPGYDLRALGTIYLKSLAEAGYKVICVTRDEAKGKQPIQDKAISGFDVHKVYYNFKGPYSSQLNKLVEVVLEYKPAYIIVHSNAFDPVWPVAFSLFKNIPTRYLVNLTDHGFWIGKDFIDYVLEFRDYGASISAQYRKINKEKLIKLPYYPYIDKQIPFKGLPLNDEDKFFFSGGNLKKTLGEDNLYYDIVKEILTKNPNVHFLYAGMGDTSRIEKLQSVFSNRVVFINERDDLYQIMCRCVFYLNTYPVIGGLMTQYAAACGKVPLTLSHGNRTEGLLLDDNDPCFFTDKEALIKDACRLLTDDTYLNNRSNYIHNLVVDPSLFSDELKKALETKATKFEFKLMHVESDVVHEEHKYAFDLNDVRRSIARINHKKLIRFFPILFIKRKLLAFQGKM